MSDIFYKKDYIFFKNLLINNIHFKYSRFNDGELIASSCLTPNGCNCDNHQYFYDMGVELQNILLNYKNQDNYYLQTYDYWYNELPLIKELINKYNDINNNLVLIDTDFIRYIHENEPDNYIELLNILFKKKVCVVGPYYLSRLKCFFNFDFIEVPTNNCYLSKDIIINNINNYKNDNPEDVIYLFCASMLSNILIDYFKDNNTYIDWGSTFDTFFNSFSNYNIYKRQMVFLKNNNINLTEKYKNYIL